MDFHARQHDPQTGRFLGVDPLAAQQGQDMYSPYAAMGNAPESIVDPNGEAMRQSMTGNGNHSFMANSKLMGVEGVEGSWASGAGSGSGGGGANVMDAINAFGNSMTFTNANDIAQVLGMLQGGASVSDVQTAFNDGGTGEPKVTKDGGGKKDGVELDEDGVVVIRPKGFFGRLWGGVKSGVNSAWNWVKGYQFHFELGGTVTWGKQLGAEIELGGGGLGAQGGKDVKELLSGKVNVTGDEGNLEGYYYGQEGVYKNTSGGELAYGVQKIGVEDSWNTGKGPANDQTKITNGYGLFTNEITLPNSNDAKFNHSLLLDAAASVKVFIGIEIKARIGFTHD